MPRMVLVNLNCDEVRVLDSQFHKLSIGRLHVFYTYPSWKIQVRTPLDATRVNGTISTAILRTDSVHA